MDDERDIKESFLNRHLLTIGLIILLVGIVLVILAPYLFTQFSLAYSLTGKGEIGDAISGTTAPIVGLIGSVLVFLSLFAQIQANRLVLREFEEERKRYKSEFENREKQRQEDDERYRRERVEFDIQKGKDEEKAQLRQQKELFTQLLSIIQMNNAFLQQMTVQNNLGTVAIEKTLESASHGNFTPNFRVLEIVLRTVRSTLTTTTAPESLLQTHHVQLIASQLLIVLSKYEFALQEALGRQDTNIPRLQNLIRDSKALQNEIGSVTSMSDEPSESNSKTD